MGFSKSNRLSQPFYKISLTPLCKFTILLLIFKKVGELVQVSGGQMDDQLKEQFTEITSVILSNQTEALANLTKKVEREIGQVWRQMGKDTFFR